ncbi:MAG TPA: hypothetical protein VF717_06520 [Pyrinomonadaceae bacterium]|jgi:hypothetical protein
MNAQHSLLEKFVIEQDAAEEPGELESIDTALKELNEAYARNRIDFRGLTQRRDQLLTRKAILRRRKVRATIFADAPPVVFYSIEREGQTEAQRINERQHLKRILKKIVERNNPARNQQGNLAAK